MGNRQQLSTKVNKSDEELSAIRDLAINMRIDGFRYTAIAEKVNREEQTVRTWFMRGGTLYDEYIYRMRERKKESRKLQKDIHNQISDAAVDAVATLKTKTRKGNVLAALGIMKLAGFEPAQKVEAEVKNDDLDKVAKAINQLGDYVKQNTPASNEGTS